MKANNLSISIPNYGCNKNCPYCISRMTGYVESNEYLMYKNLKKVFNISNKCNVCFLTFTSKGEILSNNKSYDILLNMLEKFKDHFSCELQTNGLDLNEENIFEMSSHGLNTIAISVDSFSQIQEFNDLFNHMNSIGLTIRLTVNLVDPIYFYNIGEFFYECKNFNIHQISFRKISIPNNQIVFNDKAIKTKEWIENNIDNNMVDKFINEYNLFLYKYGTKIRDLPYGAYIYDVDGISFTYFDYCIQDQNNDDNIRSLIFHEDGHLSTTWYGSNVGRIL